MEGQVATQNEKNAGLKQKIEEAKASREVEGQDGESREALLEKLAALKAQNSELKKDFAQYEKCDPARLDSMKVNTKICKEACDRWVDNIFVIESYIKKQNPAVSSEDLANNFEVLKDLDYVEYVPKKWNL